MTELSYDEIILQVRKNNEEALVLLFSLVENYVKHTAKKMITIERFINYTIDEIHWNLYPKGSIDDWDGLTRLFIDLVNNDNELLKDSYIKSWYKASVDIV